MHDFQCSAHRAAHEDAFAWRCVMKYFAKAVPHSNRIRQLAGGAFRARQRCRRVARTLQFRAITEPDDKIECVRFGAAEQLLNLRWKLDAAWRSAFPFELRRRPPRRPACSHRCVNCVEAPLQFVVNLSKLGYSLELVR